VWGRTNVGGAPPSGPGQIIGGLGQSQVGSGANSGSSTPFGGSARSGLGNTVFAEEEEDELEEMERIGKVGVIGGGFYSPVGGAFGDLRLRTATSDTMTSSTSTLSSGIPPSSAYTTPDMNLLSPGMSGMNGSNSLAGASLSVPPASATTPTTPTPLTPVIALPTGDSEAQIGLAKVAEADVDAFMTYASIVPEFCRLEGMVIKNIV